MSVTELFERKYLFGLGRHLWNFVGVSGYIALLTGFILFIEGNSLESAKSKTRYIGRNKIITTEKIDAVKTEMLSYEDWKEKKSQSNEKLLAFDEWLQEKATDSEKLLSFNEWSAKNNISIPDKSNNQYKTIKNKYLKYQEKFINGVGSDQYDKYKAYQEAFLSAASLEYEEYEAYREPFDKQEKNLTLLQKQQNSKYSTYLGDVSYRNNQKRARAITSPFVMGYGLAVIASASLSSAVLAIERNSRKEN